MRLGIIGLPNSGKTTLFNALTGQNLGDLNTGRNPAEVLRVLDALQTDERCPCNWQKGEKTLNATAA